MRQPGAVAAPDPSLDLLGPTATRALGVAALAMVATLLTLTTFVAAADALNDLRRVAAADECDVSTYVENHSLTDPVPDRVWLADRQWLPPEVRCEGFFGGRIPVTFRVSYSHWHALGALVVLVPLLGLALWGVRELWTSPRPVATST